MEKNMGQACGRILLAAAAFAAVALIAGCGGGDGGSTAPTPAVANIGATGGVVHGEGGAQVAFPPKALAADVTVRISKDGTGAPPLPPVATAAGAVYMITPHGGALAIHAEVSIPVDRTDLGPDEQMVMLTAQPGDSQWTVLSGATYRNSAMHAPVMHFSYFRVVTLNVSMPSLSLVLVDGGWGNAAISTKSNNVGGPGVARFGADYEFGPGSFVQFSPSLEAKLTYPPSSPISARVFGAPPPEPCLPTSYAHDALNLRFLRNGTETVSPAIYHWAFRSIAEAQYPRFEDEIEYITTLISGMFLGAPPSSGMGALHLYGANSPRRGPYQSNPANALDVWALPPAGNVASDDALNWRGRFELKAEQHNGRIRIDASIATTCGLLIEATPLAFNLNIGPANPRLYGYNGVVPVIPEAAAGMGAVATMQFVDERPENTQSIAWEYSNDIVNWQKLPVPAQYIRDDGNALFEGHKYSIVIPNVQPAQAGWYRAWSCIDSVPPLCFSKGAVKLVVLTAPPVVTEQPLPQIVQVGETATFNVRGEEPTTADLINGRPGPLVASIQWQRRPLAEAAFNFGSWTTIPGATDRSYTTPVTSANDTGMLFRAVLTTVLGSTPSSAALLTVVERLDPPSVLAQPTNLNVVVGATAVFVATVSGTPPLSYQWRKDGVNVAGANTAVLTLSNAIQANAGRYQLVVTNRAGSVTTDPATLVVTLATPVDLPPSIAAPPASITVAAGNSANFAVAVSGTGPYSYLWMKDGQPIVGPPAGLPSFGIPVVTASDAGAYAVRVTNAVGTAVSAPATLTVVPLPAPNPVAPAIVTPPVGLAVQPGAAATLAVAVTGTSPFTYQWLHDGVAIAGANGPVLHIAAVTGLDAGQYAIEVRNAAGVQTSAAAPLIVIGAPAITLQPGNASVAEGGGATFTVIASGDFPRYQWTRNGVAIAGAVGASYTTPTLALADSGAVFAVVVYNGAGAVFSSGAVLTVTSAPALTASTLVSVSTTSVMADNTSSMPSVSADGRVIAFLSYGTNLVTGSVPPGTENGNAYVRNLATRVTTLVNQTPAGAPSSRGVIEMKLSANGRYVVFTSLAGDLVEGDTNGSMDVFVRDLQTGITTRVNVLPNGDQITGAGNAQGSLSPSISADGRWVAFAFGYDLTLTGGPLQTRALYLRDMAASTTRVAVSDSPYGVFSPVISNDGSRIVYLYVVGNQNVIGTYDVASNSAAPLFTVDGTIFPEGIGPGLAISGNGRYVAFGIRSATWIPGAASSFTQVLVVDHQNPGSPTIASTGTGGVGDGPSGYPVLSGDGRYVLFQTNSPSLTGDPAATIRSYLMVRDMVAGTTAVASRRPNGTPVWIVGFGAHALSADATVLAWGATPFDMTGSLGEAQVYAAPRP